MDSPATSAPSTGYTRAIRSFAQREDAERARATLADSDIGSTIREYRVPDPVTGKLTTRGCTLCIAPADAPTAARILLKMPPSEAPGAAPATARPESASSSSRLRRRGGKPERQKSSFFMISFAILCAAGMVIFVTSGLFGPKKPKKLPHSTDNQLIEEDLNGDTLPDVVREFTWDWIPISHTEDRNFDTLMDYRWIWQHGKPAYRDIDLNFDGKFDERTTYDPGGQPFYTDTRPGATGPVLKRKIFRDGILWKFLEDRDADNHFDHLVEYNHIAEPVRDEDLPKGSPEDNVPGWPPPPAPEPEELDPAMNPRP